MNRLLPLLLAALAALPAAAKLQGNGYYRVQNVETTRWIYVIDNRGSLNTATTSADVHAITLWKPLERALSDPASVIYVSGSGTDYDFAAQGTSVTDIIDMTAKVREVSGDRYLIYGSKSGITKYLGDGEKGWMDEGYMTDNATGNERYWYFDPMSTDSPDQYFGLKPDFSADGQNWGTIYASFPWSPASEGIETMYVTKIDRGHAIAVVKPCPAQIAGGTAVLFRTASTDPAANRVELLAPGSGTKPTDSQMKGTYFNYLHAQYPNRTLFDPARMRVLGVMSNGKVGFVSTPPSDDGYIPRNHCWTWINPNTPDELQIMDEQQYQDYLSSLPVPVQSVTLNATSRELTEGDTFQLTATVRPSNATHPEVTWTTSNSSVATVSASGLVTAMAPGSATITATADGVEAACAVTVSRRFVPVASITLNAASRELTEGDTFQLTATVTPADATDPTVTWTTSNSSVATVSPTGLVTAVAPGTATVTAKAGDKTATCAVTVLRRVIPVTGITLNAASRELTEGDAFQLTATVTPADATDPTVAWTTSDAAVATVSPTGLVTAVAPGSATITAKAGSFATSCAVTVKARHIDVESISLDRTEAEVTEGESFRLTATVLPSDASDPTVAWTSSDPAVAAVDASGLVTALAPGQAVITARAGSHSATCAVTVRQLTIPVASVTLDASELEMRTGQVATLTATVLPADATSRLVTWTSSDPAVATVDGSGTVYAFYAGGGQASATITAQAGDRTAQCLVTVETYIPVASIALNYHEATVVEGQTLQLTPTVTPGNHTTPLEWTSSDPAVATVDADGLVTGNHEGTARLTLTAVQEQPVQALCQLTVLPQSGIVQIGADGDRIVVNGLEIRLLGHGSGSVHDLSGRLVGILTPSEPVTVPCRGIYILSLPSGTAKVLL